MGYLKQSKNFIRSKSSGLPNDNLNLQGKKFNKKNPFLNSRLVAYKFY